MMLKILATLFKNSDNTTGYNRDSLGEFAWTITVALKIKFLRYGLITIILL